MGLSTPPIFLLCPVNLGSPRGKSESVSCSVVSVCDPINYSLPGFSVHGILQAKILELVAVSFSPGDILDPGAEPKSPAL